MAVSTKKALFSATISLLGPVAQSVEQRIENPCVGGSIPPQATKFPQQFLLRACRLLVANTLLYCSKMQGMGCIFQTMLVLG